MWSHENLLIFAASLTVIKFVDTNLSPFKNMLDWAQGCDAEYRALRHTPFFLCANNPRTIGRGIRRTRGAAHISQASNIPVMDMACAQGQEPPQKSQAFHTPSPVSHRFPRGYGGTRTHKPWYRKPALYPFELRSQKCCLTCQPVPSHPARPMVWFQRPHGGCGHGASTYQRSHTPIWGK